MKVSEQTDFGSMSNRKGSTKCLIKNNYIFTKSNDNLKALNDTFFEAFSRDEQQGNVNLDSDGCGHLSNILPLMPNIEVTFKVSKCSSMELILKVTRT